MHTLFVVDYGFVITFVVLERKNSQTLLEGWGRDRKSGVDFSKNYEFSRRLQIVEVLKLRRGVWSRRLTQTKFGI